MNNSSAKLSLVVLFCSVFFALIFSFTPIQAKSTAPQSNTFLSLPARSYQLQYQVAESGWTDSLREDVADVYASQGNSKAAAAQWSMLQSQDYQVQRRLADVYYQNTQWSEYIEILRTLYSSTPEDAWVNYHLGLALAPVNPPVAGALLRRAALTVDYSNVSADLLSVLINQPEDPLIGFRIGLVLVQHELWDYAERAFNQAYIVGYPYTEAAAYLALVRARQNKSGEDLIQYALQLSSASAEIHYVHGLYLRALFDYDASLQAFRLAMNYAPAKAAYAAELGTAYRLTVDYPSAEYWLQRSVQLSGNAAEYQQLLATFYSQESTNVIPSGIEIVRDVRQSLPADPTLISGLGWALYTAGDIDSALEQFDSALAIQPGHLQSLYYKARVLAGIGDLENAIPLMEQVAASDSDYTDVAIDYLATWQD